jgi:hypothetical protein
MLVKMLPSQVGDKWDILSYAISQSLPPTVMHDEASVEKALNNIRLALLKGTMQAWIVSEGNKVQAVSTTAVTVDSISGERNLIIYTLFGYRKMAISQWSAALDTLKHFAKTMGCSLICAFSDVERVKEIASGLDANVSNLFIKWEV